MRSSRSVSVIERYCLNPAIWSRTFRPTGVGAAIHQNADKITGQAQKWVAQTFFGTLLKHMHESPFRSELFDGGRGGQAFSSLYDQQMADRMAHAAGRKLVRGIVRQIEGRMRGKVAPAQADAAYRSQDAQRPGDGVLPKRAAGDKGQDQSGLPSQAERSQVGHVPAGLRA